MAYNMQIWTIGRIIRDGGGHHGPVGEDTPLLSSDGIIADRLKAEPNKRSALL